MAVRRTVRISDPKVIDRAAVQSAVERGLTATVQFSQASYHPDLLASLNEVCAEFGADVDVRFFGHHRGHFDAATLALLPDVRSLSVDSLLSISNERHIAGLTQLSRLRFGVYRFDQPEFLKSLDIAKLEALTLGETAKRNLDLTPLAGARQLESLFVQGHTKGMTVVSGLSTVSDLGLSGISARQDLAFLNDMAGLRSLLIILGSRASIEEFSHPRLTDVRIIRVRKLERLGPIARFPSLETLAIEDQLQIRSLDLVGASARRIVIDNCKNLTEVAGWGALERLAELRIARTSLDLEGLAEQQWPASLKVLALYAGGRKRNAALRAILDHRGFRELAKDKAG
jgi:hypothetical protein